MSEFIDDCKIIVYDFIYKKKDVIVVRLSKHNKHV